MAFGRKRATRLLAKAGGVAEDFSRARRRAIGCAEKLFEEGKGLLRLPAGVQKACQIELGVGVARLDFEDAPKHLGGSLLAAGAI